MRIISISNQKGGVGKTTSTVNISAGLTLIGKKVLAIDLDPQSHLTYSFGIKSHLLKKSTIDLLKGEVTLEDVIITKEGVDIVPATMELSSAEIEFSQIAGREYIVKEILEGVKGYDYVLFDCPPNLSLLTLNALTASTDVFIVLQTEFLSLQGLTKLIETIKIVRKRLNNKLNISGIIPTMFDSRKILHRNVVSKIRNVFKTRVFETNIRHTVSLAEAPSFGQSIMKYKPTSNGCEDYMKLCKEIIQGESNVKEK